MEPTDYWRGRVDARVDDAERRLDAINGSIEKTANKLSSLDTAVASLKTKVAVYSALGAGFGAALISTVSRHI